MPGVQVAGKTGTTQNYGDAWFVGFTPDVVAAVWVGYPNSLVPMLTEFHGHTVEGGTFPALIWKAFMEKALPYMAKRPMTRRTPLGASVARPRDTLDGHLPPEQARARQRRVPRRGDDPVLHGDGADGGGTVQAERGRGAGRPRLHAVGGQVPADRAAAAGDGESTRPRAGADASASSSRRSRSTGRSRPTRR